MIPLSVPNMCGDELENLKECIDTGWLSTSGKYVEIFEKKMSAFVGSKHAIGCMNGTAALHVSLRLLGVEPADEVIVPSLTFISPLLFIPLMVPTNSTNPLRLLCFTIKELVSAKETSKDLVISIK